jgi:regulator of sirC expression with transglutaminase-like and TPR domain
MMFSIARQRFYQELQQPDEAVDITKCALFIAQEEYPNLEVDAYLNALDTMADEVRERLPIERYPLRILKVINQYLYNDLGFRGNTEDYYDPRNSFLNDVVERRTGIPITLSLVYLAIAQRIDFPMVEVNMPGHFLIRPDLPDLDLLVDPFYQGEILFKDDCQTRLTQIYGHAVPLQPNFFERPSPRRFLARMLMNLKAIYLQQEDLLKTLACTERMLLLFPDTPLELRDRGLLYYQLQRWTEARYDLEAYLTRTPNAPDRSIIERLLAQIQ